MKILYIGTERRDAQAVARALRGITQNVPLAWTQSLDHCAKYLAQHRDLAALVIEAQVHAGRWPSSLKDLRSLPARPAIVVVVPEGTPPTFDSLAPAPDEVVINGQTFLTDLPTIVSRAVARVRGSQPPATTSIINAETFQQRSEVTPDRTETALPDLNLTSQADLEQKLADATAALQQAQRRHAAAMAAERMAHELAAAEQLTEQERQFQVEIALERDKRRTVEDMLSEAASALEESERRYASALTNAAAQTRELERAGQREAQLVAQSQSEVAMRAALEQEVVNADVTVRDLQRRHDAALAKAAAELAEQRAHVDRELSRTAAEGDQLRERLMNAELALYESQHNHESVAAEVARLTQREADLSAQLVVVESERAAAENRLELKLAREIDAREILERKLNEIRSDAFDGERKFREEAAALRAHASEREAYFEARLASECREYEERLKEQALRHDVSLRASERARTELQERLQAALAAGRQDVELVHETLMATVEAVKATKRRHEMLQTEADRILASHQPAQDGRANNLEVVQQPELATLPQLNQDAALV